MRGKWKNGLLHGGDIVHFEKVVEQGINDRR
jgi:hypothetical protein